MKTMLDKIGIIGDVKTAFNRLGIDTLAVVCVGGSSGTAVKVVTCDTVGGVYTDFLTLKADALNINEGFCFSLIGAKKFVKITGCDNAIGIVGDCDYDVKQVTFNTVTIAGADLENNKAQTINVSTYTEPVAVTPTEGKDGMKKATITLSNIPIPESKLFAFGSAEGVVYLAEIPAEDGAVTVYVPSATSLGTTEGAYAEEKGVSIDKTTYARYASGDITF